MGKEDKEKKTEQVVKPQDIPKTVQALIAELEAAMTPQRLIILATDGNKINAIRVNSSQLELKQICIEILKQYGG